MKTNNSLQTQAHVELILKVRLAIAMNREDLLAGMNEELKQHKSNK